MRLLSDQPLYLPGAYQRVVFQSLIQSSKTMRPVEKWKNSGLTRPLASRPRVIAILITLLLASFWNGSSILDALLRLTAVSSAPRSILIRENATIQWTACPDNSTFYCSFFAVPLDYDAPSAEDKTVIAMRMFPATVPSAERLGSLFTNPGVSRFDCSVSYIDLT
jgi:hypothetical protein